MLRPPFEPAHAAADPSPDRPRGNGRLLSAAAIIVAWVMSLMGAVWATATDRTAVRQTLEVQAATVADHETRLRATEDKLGRIAADCEWIRKTLEKRP